MITLKTPSGRLQALRWTLEIWMHHWSVSRAERRLWAEAATFQELAELTARWCEGELLETPSHGGPRFEETVPIGSVLAHANRRGFLTENSQPGMDETLGLYDRSYLQRAAVMGYAQPATLARLAKMVEGTRLVLHVDSIRRWGSDRSVSVPVTGDTEGVTHTGFGGIPSRRTVKFHFEGCHSDAVDEVLSSGVVLIYDPWWGEHDLLWERLSQL